MGRSAPASFLLHALVVFSTLLVRQSTGAKDEVYATTLSSDSFLLGTRVLGYALRRVNATRPFMVLCTTDVSQASMDRLRLDGFIVHKTTPLHTPYKATHVLNKYQYTKIRLWTYTDYAKIIHIDADCLPMVNVDELFDCGHFCAVMRHSDMFNSGVFTLVPDQTVYEDMMNKRTELESYDGGDQGGTEDGAQNKLFAKGVHRLSFFYNADVGMYYLNSHFIRQPKIIHYTLGPVKPWIWWTYPLFDQNWQWLVVRELVEATTGPSTSLPTATLLLLTIIMFAVYYTFTRILRRSKRLSMMAQAADSTSAKAAPVLLIGLGTMVAYGVVPEQMHPYTAWCLFGVVQFSTTFLLNCCYCDAQRMALQ
uniref:glycogenin glucosyltransferase n=1 Tax=Plectus sambesii TaxID=2011161 RepID=A0A914V9Y4_9BILA